MTGFIVTYSVLLAMAVVSFVLLTIGNLVGK